MSLQVSEKIDATVPAYNPRDGSRVWLLGQALKLPSDFTLFLDNCTLQLAEDVFCNLIINEKAYKMPLSKAEEQKNINVIGLGETILHGDIIMA